MSAEVVKLTERLLPGEVSEDIVAAIEGLLARAKSGEISAFAWAGYATNDATFNGWESEGGTMFQLGASIMVLQSRYANMMQEDAE
jgi:hypothetical protein